MAIEKIGVMTGGGDCPGLNAVIRAVVIKAHSLGWRVFGIEDATHGLVDLDYRSPHGNRWITPRDVSDILKRGGTILGTSNRSDPWHFVVEEDGVKKEIDVSHKLLENWKTLGLDALIAIGGDGSMKIAKQMLDMGINVVGVPKTIDNDLAGTDVTFGFSTAVSIATDALDRLQDTAESHDRVMILEVMGRNAGWIALHTALAGGAHACLIPEIPYEVAPIVKKIKARKEAGYPFSIIACAEGAKPKDGEESYEGPRELGAMRRLLGAGQRLAAALQPHLDLDVRVTTLGHIQRGGSPTHFDRILGTRFGVAAVEAVAAGKFGQMVALKTPNIVTVPIEDALQGACNVEPDGQMVHAAKAVGVCFG